MVEQDWLAQRFEEHRSRLRAVAYRMLGSLSEADDAVQDTWLRLSRTNADEVENLGGWLTTVVARVSLNMLRSRQTRREEPFGPHVPEPIIDPVAGMDPEHEALLADSVGLALLVVLEMLAPAERLAFVLHDMFAVPFDEIAPIVDRSPEAARQLASRARRRVQGNAPVSDADPEQQRQVVEAFIAAAREGDFDALVALLDPDIVLRADSGPGAAAPRPSRSAARPRWPAGRSPSPGCSSTTARCSSTACSAWWPTATVSRSRSGPSRCEAGGSSRWTSSPTPSVCAGSTSRPWTSER